ncbi:hypothetical protein [Streptomyces omiyaensis]|uniref:Uncharacterized protein n=1 Tax=Streptomyces omiyaensis TaxID=68247 RepID=A0ABW7BK42_9ACTN|nr:hypothetical protein [Streptomyces omiyaensis]GGY46577.1 hypothetical protein GCM10010363_29140 [Streptomyces omiyaensis]
MSLKEHATRVAVLRVLRDAVDTEYGAERHEVLQELRAARAELDLKSVRVTLPDDTPVATLTLVDPRPVVVVADEESFTAWVADNHPGEVETLVRVRPGWQRQFLARLSRLDPVADPHTGEAIPGLGVLSPSEPRSFSLRPLPGGRERIARALRTGTLDLHRLLPLEGGENP